MAKTGKYRSYYFIISATDINAQPEFCRKPIVYTPSAYFGKDAARKIYSAYPGSCEVQQLAQSI